MIVCVGQREKKWIAIACTVSVPVIVTISEMQITTRQYDLSCAIVDWTPHQALKPNSKKRWKLHHPPAKISPQSEKNNPCHLSWRKHLYAVKRIYGIDRKEVGSSELKMLALFFWTLAVLLSIIFATERCEWTHLWNSARLLFSLSQRWDRWEQQIFKVIIVDIL